MSTPVLVLLVAILFTLSSLNTSFGSTVITKVSQSSDNCKLVTESERSKWIIEKIYKLDKICKCDSISKKRAIYSRPEILLCFEKCVSSTDGQPCNQDKLPLWETYNACCENCNGIMTVATISYDSVPDGIVFEPLPNVCSHVDYISPTPKPQQCEYITNSYSSSSPSISTINHECSCGNNFKISTTNYSESMVQCAKECISKKDGEICSMLKMPLNIFYDECCKSCGAEQWSMNTGQGSDSALYSRVCILPLLTTPAPTSLGPLAVTPTPTPTPFLTCNYKVKVKRSKFNSTKKMVYRCNCNRKITTKPSTAYTLYSDLQNFKCYRNCLRKTKSQKCNPNEFYPNFAEDCCSICDGTSFKQSLKSSNGKEYVLDVCTPISKALVLASPSPTPLSCNLQTSVSTDYLSLPIIYNTCECERESKYTSIIVEDSIAVCVRDCVAEKNGNTCDIAYTTKFFLEDCCSKCNGAIQLKPVTYVSPNTGPYDKAYACSNLSPALTSDSTQIRDSYELPGVLKSEKDLEEFLTISSRLMSAALNTEIEAGDYKSTVTAELFFDQDNESSGEEKSAGAEKMLPIRIGKDIDEVYSRVFDSRRNLTKYISSASRQQNNQATKKCTAGSKCGVKVSFQNIKPRPSQTQQNGKGYVTNGYNHWKKKGKKQNVMDQQSKYKLKYNAKTKRWELKTKFNDKALPPKQNLW